MTRFILLPLLLTLSALHAEEFARAQQFKLTDGRTVQAARMIKISARGKTTFLITLTDGRKLSLDSEEVSSISDIQLPIAMLPKVPDEGQKPVEVATSLESAIAQIGAAVAKAPATPSNAQTPAARVPTEYVNNEPVRYVRQYYYVQPQDETSTPTPTPPPPPAPVTQTPARELTSSELARRAFSTIPSFQARK